TRKEAVKRGLLSQASFDAGLALSQAMTQLQPAVAANGTVDKGLQERAAIAAQQLFASLQRETADDKNFEIVPTMGETISPGSGRVQPRVSNESTPSGAARWRTRHYRYRGAQPRRSGAVE